MRPIDQPRWDRAYAEYRDFVAAHGHGSVPKNYISPSGTALGKWATNQRDLWLAGRLLPNRLKILLYDRSWPWSPREYAWLTNHDLLQEFISMRGRAPYQSESYKGVRLGVWVRTQRRAHKEGRMSAQRTNILDATPGWLWKAIPVKKKNVGNGNEDRLPSRLENS
jgi:hypothetical protein